MTSGTFQPYLVSSIWSDDETRQRKELTGIDDLIDSIKRIGLIHPPVITKDGEIIAGRRRVEAVRRIGWTHIPVQFADELNESDLQVLELEENIRREDIPWKDQCRAVQRYQELRKKTEPKVSYETLGEALGFSPSSIGEMIGIAKAMDQGNTRVLDATKFSTARDVMKREREREASRIEKKVFNEPVEVPKVPLTNITFEAWLATYSGPTFNLIHCDFPYGRGHSHKSQKMGRVLGEYVDDEMTYWRLIGTLEEAMLNVVDTSAHLIFWFSMHTYSSTFEALTKMGWVLDPFPLIWKKNAGSIPDPNRKPFRKYETALFGSRGDRKIVTAVDNVVDYPSTKDIHMSEKSLPMLKHFMRMVVDDTTHMLDPTAGSGNACKAAGSCGAERVLGIEANQEFYERAVEAWED